MIKPPHCPCRRGAGREDPLVPHLRLLHRAHRAALKRRTQQEERRSYYRLGVVAPYVVVHCSIRRSRTGFSRTADMPLCGWLCTWPPLLGRRGFRTGPHAGRTSARNCGVAVRADGVADRGNGSPRIPAFRGTCGGVLQLSAHVSAQLSRGVSRVASQRRFLTDDVRVPTTGFNLIVKIRKVDHTSK
jgi:hypothetical protein